MPARFSASDLKWIAMGTMLVDHAAIALLYRNGFTADPYWNMIYTAMRLIGRMAFPLFAFLLVEGAFHTRKWVRYAARIHVAALVSEIPFDLVSAGRAWAPETQNTLWLLFIGLVTIKVMEQVERLGPGESGTWWTRILSLAAVLAGMGAAALFRVDYGPMGLLFLLELYVFRGRIQERTLICGALLLFMYMDFYGVAAWIAFCFINRYNGKRGSLPGPVAYVFYPAHLLILYAAGVLIHGIYV